MIVSILGVKVSLELIILIMVIYLVMMIHTLSSCCNMRAITEGFIKEPSKIPSPTQMQDVYLLDKRKKLEEEFFMQIKKLEEEQKMKIQKLEEEKKMQIKKLEEEKKLKIKKLEEENLRQLYRQPPPSTFKDPPRIIENIII